MWDSLTTTTGKRNTRGNYSNKPPYRDPYVRWCERTDSQLMAILLLDLEREDELARTDVEKQETKAAPRPPEGAM